VKRGAWALLAEVSYEVKDDFVLPCGHRRGSFQIRSISFGFSHGTVVAPRGSTEVIHGLCSTLALAALAFARRPAASRQQWDYQHEHPDFANGRVVPRADRRPAPKMA
jgi:hypothetical protein